MKPLPQMKKYRERYTTPEGIATHVNLLHRSGSDRRGIYSVNLALSVTDSPPFCASIRAAFAERLERERRNAATPEAASRMFAAKPSIIEQADGSVVVIFRARPSWKAGVAHGPKIIDAAGKILKNVNTIGDGTRMRLVYTREPFHTASGVGLTLKVVEAQIIVLVDAGTGFMNRLGDPSAIGEDIETPLPWTRIAPGGSIVVSNAG